jgi:formiminotetrahydrofolate cyclodeaminase
MVARLTIGKKKYETVRSRMETVARSADDLRERLTRAVTDDAAAFEGVLQAMRLPAGNEQEANVRSEALENATRLAARIPMTVALAAAEVAELGAEASEIGNRNAISDAGSAVYLAAAAIRSATLNVRANAAALQDQSVVPDWERAVATAAERAAAAQARVEAAIESRSG